MRPVLYVLFTLSGLTGLIYESTWTRYLQLFLGHAAYAQVLVLALFMGGMGAGALLAGRLAGTLVHPLTAYALTEAALGIAALAFHWVFDGATTYAYATLLPGTQGSVLAQTLQWILAAALILPQSLLLGMTFPLMSSAILRQESQPGGRVFAMLYFCNSAGAVIGVLLAGFWLTELYGLQVTMIAAGATNIVIALIALFAGRRDARNVPAVVRTAHMDGVGRWLLLAAFMTAVASFLYEIAWLRMLALVQGASTHAFETMLSAFILGLALGGLWIRGRIERYRSPLLVLARVQVLMALAAVATLPAYHYAFDVMQAAMAQLPRDGHGYAAYTAVGYLISACIMVPASFFAGMTLPLLTWLLYQRGRGEAEIGAVYGWNTLGGIAGIALGGLVLMPLIGLKNMIVLGAAVDAGLGIAIFAYLYRSKEMPLPRWALALSGTAMVALLCALLLFKLDTTRLVSGVFRDGRAQIAPTSKIISYADGRTATVSLTEETGGNLVIATNGKPDAAIEMGRARGNLKILPGSDEYTMSLLAALPLAHAPTARQAAIIGHGSGLTTHALLASPAIEHVDVIEIEPEMIRAARGYLPRVARAYDDPRASFRIADARAFFARSPRRYDIVISEPSNPWVSGVASLFTPEFYTQARRALAPGGLFVQWFHLHEIDRPLVRSIVGAIGTVFSDYVLYGANETDVVLVATASGAMPPLTAVPFTWPKMREDLAYLDIREPAQLQLFRVASRRAYAPLLEGGRVNSDYFPTLEFGAARARYERSSDSALIDLARDPASVLEILSGFPMSGPVAGSSMLATVYPRFGDVKRANAFAAMLAEGDRAQTGDLLPEEDMNYMRTLLHLRPEMSAADWSQWFTALYQISKPMLPNGAAPALEGFIRSKPVADALRRAPETIRARVEFLSLAGKRDFGRIRQNGPALLAGPLVTEDPAFHAYVLVSTITACLASPPPDAVCRQVISLLDRVRRQTPLIELLRAHRAALR